MTLISFYHACPCYQHFGGCTGYGHDEAGGREALDQAFAEIVGAESAIVRSQVFSFPCVIVVAFMYFLLSWVTNNIKHRKL